MFASINGWLFSTHDCKTLCLLCQKYSQRQKQKIYINIWKIVENKKKNKPTYKIKTEEQKGDGEVQIGTYTQIHTHTHMFVYVI